MLNYKQLHHFWNVARAGGIVRASERSGLAPQTLSGQVAALEASLGVTLFRRQGRRLALTETGQVVLSYAEEIFRTGSELEEAIANRATGRVIRFRVGVSDVLPKTIAWRLLEPALAQTEPLRLVCREDKLERLLGELAIHKLDLVLADSPMPAHMDVRGFSHQLADSAVALYAAPPLADRLGNSPFPDCLHHAPLLLPGPDAAVRRPLAHWMERMRVTPRIVGEFDDSALMKSFGQAGAGVFPAPERIAAEIQAQYGVRKLGIAGEVRETYYAICVDKRSTHPGTAAVTAASEAAQP